MIVVLKNSVSPEEEQAVVDEIKKLGYQPHIMHGVSPVLEELSCIRHPEGGREGKSAEHGEQGEVSRRRPRRVL